MSCWLLDVHARLACAALRKLVALGIVMLAAPLTAVPAVFVELDEPTTVPGYLASLLINEAPFPGERGYVSEDDTRAAMLAVLWVLHGRIHCIPAGYQQAHVAGLRSTNLIDIITGTGGKPQCEGFYRDASGRFVSAPRVQERIRNLLRIANTGTGPGRFASLLNYAKGLARAYCAEGIEGADRFAGIRRIGTVPVTGGAFAWMTDKDCFRPGGNFVSIPNQDDGSLGGNRFFTLRKTPK